MNECCLPYAIRSSRRLQIGCGVLALTLSGWILRAQPTEECLKNASASIAKTIVRGDGGRRVATAFVYKDRRTLLTTLHSVTAADRIDVEFPGHRDREWSATVTKTLPKQDLALLILSADAPADALALAPGRTGDGERVVAVGFARDTQAHIAATLETRRLGRYAKLGDYVPAEVRPKLRQLPLLSEDTEVLNLEGTLLPGHSGAPILNNKCEVVAIGDGGIDQGTVSWSWAIPVENVALLQNDTEKKQPLLGKSGQQLFALSSESDGVESSNVKTLNFKGGQFVFAARRKLAEIRSADALWSQDDPVGLLTIVQGVAMGMGGLDKADALEFDIYQHPASGAALTVPAGLALTERNDGTFRGTMLGKKLEYIAAFLKTSGLLEAQARSLEFEQVLNPQPPEFAQIQPEWTYMGWNGLPAPRVRWDGLTFIRKAAHVLQLNAFGNGQPTGYIFETLAARSDRLIAAAARAKVPPFAQSFDPEFVRAWASLTIATHLTTFKSGGSPKPLEE